MDVIEMAIRIGETAIGFRSKTLLHPIHLTPACRLDRWLPGVRRHPYGDAIGLPNGDVRIDAILPGSFPYELGKKPGKPAHSCFEIGLRIHTERIVEESSR